MRESGTGGGAVWIFRMNVVTIQRKRASRAKIATKTSNFPFGSQEYFLLIVKLYEGMRMQMMQIKIVYPVHNLSLHVFLWK